jgi:hypothetical protein
MAASASPDFATIPAFGSARGRTRRLKPEHDHCRMGRDGGDKSGHQTARLVNRDLTVTSRACMLVNRLRNARTASC